MTACTLLGQLVTGDGLARRAHWHTPIEEVGPLQYRARPARMVTDYFRIDKDNLQPVQPDWIAINLNHERGTCVGHVEHLEQRDAGLWLVADLACDPPPDLRYLSPGWYEKRDGIELSHAALTDAPAQICMTPVVTLPGRLADCDARKLPRWQVEMVERARTAAKHRRGGPVIVSGAELPAPAAVRQQPAGALWHRAAERVDVRPGRRIDVLVMPYEREAEVPHPTERRMVHEVISRGAFDDVDRQTNRIRANRDHDLTRTVGSATRFDPQHRDGLLAELRIARTPLGDETLALAQDDCLDASAGFRPVDGGMTWETRDRYRVTKAWLGHIALTPDPAYVDARVLAVRGASRAPNVDAVLTAL